MMGPTESMGASAHPELYPRVLLRDLEKRSVPDMYAPGSKAEAECSAEPLMAAWKAKPTARRWLMGQSNPHSSRKPGRR
jgi:hypothetical protein